MGVVGGAAVKEASKCSLRERLTKKKLGNTDLNHTYLENGSFYDFYEMTLF